MRNLSFSHLIRTYLSHNKKEHFKSENYDGDPEDTIDGMTVGLLLTLIIVNLVIWIWALVVLIMYWKVLPTWAQVLGIIGLLPYVGFPLLTIVVVYVGKST